MQTECYSPNGSRTVEGIPMQMNKRIEQKAKVLAGINYPAPPNEIIFAYSVNYDGRHIALLCGSYSGILKSFPKLRETISLFGARADRVETKYGFYERNRRKGFAKLISRNEFNKLAELEATWGDENPVIYEVYERNLQEKA